MITRNCGRVSVLSLALLGLFAPLALRANSIIPNSNSGWVNSAGTHLPGNTNYFAGNSVYNYRDWFTFDLRRVSGTILGATLKVDSYTISAAGTYSIYGTSLTPAKVVTGTVADYKALTGGALIGTIALAPKDSNELLTISLNSAGLSWLQANEGNRVVLGGSYASKGYAFGYSSFGLDRKNVLNISSTPEPSSLYLLGTGLFALGGLVRRKLRA